MRVAASRNSSAAQRRLGAKREFGPLAARTEAHAIAVLLYARQHIVRPLAVDGSAMRAIAAVLVVEKLDSFGAECDGVRELAGLSTVAALATRFGTTTQQIAKYRDLLGHCRYHGGRQSKCSQFCPHFKFLRGGDLVKGKLVR